ncbi:MAG TPA: ABC transporter permease [Longimicrobiales bacterium]|nr:ABC transporter permease [Longimicrobiales bacterium]
MRTLRLTLRTLFKSPFVTTVAILSLALGIGANAAIFSLFDQILLSPLPVQEPERLVNLSSPGPKPGSQSCNQAGDCDVVFSYAMFRDLEAGETAFSGVAAHRLFGANVAYNGITLNGQAMMVSGSYFPVLGLRPAQGRLIGPADDETIGAHPVAVVSHRFWQGRLGGDPGIVGQTIVVNGQSLNVIGVAPAGFDGTTLGARPMVFVPITMRTAMNPGWAGFDNRQNYWAYLFARLKPGATIERATAAVNAVYAPIINDVEAPLQEGMSDATMAQFRAKEVGLEEGSRGQSSTHTEARTPLLMLLGTAAIVLLIACANIANLLLARGANRGMEMAVRLSLGANRRQVLTQLLTESVVLGVLGGIAGLIVAHWTLAGIAALLPPEAADSLDLRLDGTVVLFAAVLAISTGLLFGLFPALHSTRSDLVTTIRANAGNLTVTRGAARFRATLVTTQIALSMALLITAGLFLRSLTNVARVDLGLTVENVITFGIAPQLNGYEPERAKQLFQRVEEELAALPGVTGVTSSLVPILSGDNWGSDVNVEGFERGPDTDANARFNMIGPEYFATLGVPILAGREFTASDNESGADVVIVNEAFAKKFNLGRDVVGKRMASGGDEELNMEIVGLVRDAKYSEVKDDVPPLFFTPWRQTERVGGLAFYVRTGIDPDEIMRAIPGVIARLDPNLPIHDFKSMPQQVRENVFMDRMIGTMSATFAALATLLAAIGLYGVLAYTVARRTREIGVRMALGADRRSVQLMVLRQVGVMLLVGGVIGIAGALALGRGAGSLLYGVNDRDPVIFVGAAILLSLFALAAGYIPALRASRVDPLHALRYE